MIIWDYLLKYDNEKEIISSPLHSRDMKSSNAGLRCLTKKNTFTSIGFHFPSSATFLHHDLSDFKLRGNDNDIVYNDSQVMSRIKTETQIEDSVIGDDGLLSAKGDDNDKHEPTRLKDNKPAISTIQNDDLTDVDEWVASADATLATLPDVNYIYYGDNVYSVDSTGTLDASTPPVHTTGTVTNGTVDLTYVRKVFGNLEFKSKNINFVLTDHLQINSTDLVLNPDGSDFKIQSGLSDLSFGFNPTSQNSNQVYKITSDGSLSFNKGYGSASDNYQKVLDYELKEFELLDTKLISNTGQLDSSVTTSVGITLSSWDTAISGKIFVEIEEQYASPVTNPQRQYSEISYLIAEDAQDILYTETNKLYNNALLGDVTLSLDTSSPKNIIINFAHSTASNTALYNIKVVSQLIRR